MKFAVLSMAALIVTGLPHMPHTDQFPPVHDEIVEEVQKVAEKAAESESEVWESLGTFKITAYCGGSCCNGGWAGQTSTGVKPTPHHTIAVAPWVIPYGTEVRIEGCDYTYVAEDTGGFAKRNDH